MTVKALKKDGRLDDFNPSNRDGERGVFLLLQGEGTETLVIDEIGLEHHEDLFSWLSSDLRTQEVLGGGRYGQNVIKIYSHTPKWNLTWHSLKYGNIENPDLQSQIAKIITNCEQNQLLD